MKRNEETEGKGGDRKLFRCENKSVESNNNCLVLFLVLVVQKMLRIFIVDRWHFKNAFQCVALPSHNVLAFIVCAAAVCYWCRLWMCLRLCVFVYVFWSVYVNVSCSMVCMKADRNKRYISCVRLYCVCTEWMLRFTVTGWLTLRFSPLILFRSFFLPSITNFFPIFLLHSHSLKALVLLVLSHSFSLNFMRILIFRPSVCFVACACL